METNLKARTLGAVVTVLALALILPNILHRDKNELFTTEIPAKPSTPDWVDSGQHTRVRIELNELIQGESDTKMTAQEPRVTLTDDPAVDGINKNRGGLEVDGVAVAWTLQAGAFSDEINAIKYRDKLRENGFKAYVLKNTNTKLDHVYVGPMIKRSKAEAERARLMSEMSVEGIRLQQYKPE